ncbi:MAG: TonB-dependent receptor [Bacteroidales bacterium]|nr:TonB-dependent receptor [Bacteroidales bacterium]
MQQSLASKKRTLTKLVVFCLMACIGLVGYAQHTVSGRVTDASGEPLIGASVIQQGQTRGVATDINGLYTISVPSNSSLVVSYIGYNSETVAVNGRSQINIVLTENSTMLDDVVVVGYGTMSRKDVTSSISTVKAEDLNVGSFTDPGQLLQGKVPGLVVVQNSDPNAGVNSISLRGASTLRTGEAAEPLYVVDGIPGVNLNLIPASEIESIDVLRDASATAIYGSKAANGVIMITTKRGAEGPARVTYSGYFSWENIVNDHDMLSADELRAYAKANDITISNDKGANTNWQDEVQRTGWAQNHTLSINGGNKSTTYMASLSYMSREGVIRCVGNNLFTARTYVETKTLKDRLTLGVGVNGNVRNEWGLIDRAQEGASGYNAMYYYSPLVPVYNEDGSYYEDYSISRNYNPMALLYENRSKAEYKRYQVTGKASLMIIDGLFLNANFSYENDQYNYKEYDSSQSPTVLRNGKSKRDTKEDIKKLMEIYANYDKTFNQVHKLGLMAGYSWEKTDIGDGFGAEGYNYYDDAIGWNNIGLANTWDADPIWGNVNAETKMISFYGRANYSFDSKYMLTAAIRHDGSSAFGSNNKWANFPSVSAAWRISSEKFMENSPFDDLKIRAGWGQSGNAKGFDIYTARFYYQSGARFSYTDPDTGLTTTYKALNAARNVNDDLKWETTTMLNLGLDFAFLNGRINGTIEYYNKTTKDMIWDYPVSTVFYPVGTLTANVGKMRNRGFEITLNATPVQLKDFSWTTSLNFSHNKNKVVSVSNSEFNAGILNEYNPNLPGASTATIQRIIEGEPIGTFYMWEFAGYDDAGSSLFYVHDPETGERTGETTATPTEDDRCIVGNAQPKLTMGWNNNIFWKGFDLNLFFTGVFGQKIFNEPLAYYSDPSLVATGYNVMKAVYDQSPTDTRAALPSDRYLENGSYFKLSTLTLGYTFRNCFNGWLRDLRIYASCNNVFTITNYSGRDPEICLGGLTPGIDSRHDHYPRTRQFLVGATINF